MLLGEPSARGIAVVGEILEQDRRPAPTASSGTSSRGRRARFRTRGRDRASDRSGPGRCRAATGSWFRASTSGNPTRPAGRARALLARARWAWSVRAWTGSADGVVGRRRRDRSGFSTTVVVSAGGGGGGCLVGVWAALRRCRSGQSERQRGIAQAGARSDRLTPMYGPPRPLLQSLCDCETPAWLSAAEKLGLAISAARFGCAASAAKAFWLAARVASAADSG